MKKLKQIRLKLGLTQQQLGEAVGVSNHAINKYEIGIRKPGGNLARKLILFCAARGELLSLDDIYAPDEEFKKAS